jgi:hypothetical protein
MIASAYRPDVDMLAKLMPDLADADLVEVVEMIMRAPWGLPSCSRLACS